jgi:hypothetical protein
MCEYLGLKQENIQKKVLEKGFTTRQSYLLLQNIASLIKATSIDEMEALKLIEQFDNN